jgi:hypothetical protein
MRARQRAAAATPARSVEEKLEHVAAGRGFSVLPESTATYYQRPDVVWASQTRVISSERRCPSLGDISNRLGTRTNLFGRFRHVTAISRLAFPSGLADGFTVHTWRLRSVSANSCSYW